jgi:putative membrane protein
MFDTAAFVSGALYFLLAFVISGLFALAFKYVYQWITPHNEKQLIREGNTAAAIVLGGAIIGYVIPLASALTQTHSLPEFVAWALLAGVIQIAAFWIVRQVALRDVSARIERGEAAVAVYLAAISVAVGILNAACMTS